MNDLTAVAWPLSRIADALETLARHAGLDPKAQGTVTVPAFGNGSGQVDFDRWLDRMCERLGVEMQPVEASGAELADMLRGAGPALLRYRQADKRYVLLLLKASARSVQLLSPQLQIRKFPLETVRAAICAEAEAAAAAEVAAWLQQVRVSGQHRARIEGVLLRERVAAQRFGGCWTLRRPHTVRFSTQIRDARLPGRVIGMLAVFVSLYVLEIAGWGLIGQGALGGRVDPGWLIAWALLLLGLVPMRLAGGWLQGTLTIDAGILLKQRLLTGALRMPMQAVRQQGAGRLLSRVIESEALESLMLSGGFYALIAVAELSVAAWVLAHGAGGVWHAVLLLSWLLTAALFGWRYYGRLRNWTRARLDLTHDLIERMVGHRTRMVQKSSNHIHEDEDEQVERYLRTSHEFDRAFVPLGAALARGWLSVGLLGLAPAFISGNAAPTALAIGLGGVLLANRALAGVTAGLAALMRAAVAREEIAPMLSAIKQDSSARAVESIPLKTSSDALPAEASKILVQARDVVFRHRAHGDPVLDGCDLTIYRGDRLLLEGSSGGGKSTLASLLTGLKQPESGLLLLDGLDRATLGDTWRRLSTAAPQFHENHVLTGTLAFNLLMGRRWPAESADLAAAEELCRELGLGDLLDRMPSGLMQMVGETGWQLSHGERSRLYLARALLQEAELVVLDETFAALDPETLDRCLRCALARAPTLLVIAHP